MLVSLPSFIQNPFPKLPNVFSQTIPSVFTAKLFLRLVYDDQVLSLMPSNSALMRQLGVVPLVD